MNKKTPAQGLDLEQGDSPTNILARKAVQLSSMLETIYGAGFESFDQYSSVIKHNYLWSCADLARQIALLSGHVMDIPQPSERGSHA